MPEQKYQIIFATGNKGKIREIKEIVEERKAASGSHADGNSAAPGSHAGGDSTAPGSHADGNSAAPGSHAGGNSAALGSQAGGDSAASGAREIEVLSMKEAGVPADPEETGKTFEENALIKAQAVYDLLLSRPAPEGTVRIVMSDDSGLEIDALGKAPGVLSARYMGYDTDYRLRMENLLQELRDVPEGKRTARFVAAVAAILPDGKSVVVRGTMEGRIGRKISGENGFGYDPFFYPDGYDITSADMSPEEKNSISHRGKALREMLSKLGLL